MAESGIESRRHADLANTTRTEDWRAVGMAASESGSVSFDGVAATAVGSPGDYVSRPGFWQGGAGIAAVWYGGAKAIARESATSSKLQAESCAASCAPILEEEGGGGRRLKANSRGTPQQLLCSGALPPKLPAIELLCGSSPAPVVVAQARQSRGEIRTLAAPGTFRLRRTLPPADSPRMRLRRPKMELEKPDAGIRPSGLMRGGSRRREPWATPRKCSQRTPCGCRCRRRPDQRDYGA
jgi:hypothetical protein